MAAPTSSLAQPCHDITPLRWFCKSVDEFFAKKNRAPENRRELRETGPDSALAGAFQDGARGGRDRFDEFARGERNGVTAPTEDPALDLDQARQLEAQLDAAV